MKGVAVGIHVHRVQVEDRPDVVTEERQTQSVAGAEHDSVEVLGTLVGEGDGWASDIVVSGDQLYISGSYFKSNKPENPVYWILKEDGTKSMTQLPKDLKTDALASSIDVDGSNVYLGGFQRDEEDNYIASYWTVTGGQKTVTRIGTPGIDSEVYDIEFSCTK